jgi:hypothetical protein
MGENIARTAVLRLSFLMKEGTITVMKKYGLICFILMGLCLCTGCASLLKKDLSSIVPVAVVSVVSNYDINWYGEGPSLSSSVADSTGRFIRRTLRRDDTTAVKISKADALIDEADVILRDMTSETGDAIFMEKSDVLAARAYAGAEINKRQENDEEIVKAEGYRFINYRDKAFAADLAAETGAGSAMYVTFEFTKVMASGIGKTGTLRAQVSMGVVIISAAGKTLYNRTHVITSAGKIPVSGGTYQEDELMDLLRSAIFDACDDFLSQYKV